MHYFDFQSRGRGQVVRLMWEDAGIAYEDIRYSFEEFPQVKRDKIAKMNPTGNIPVIELNGKILTQSYAILRHFGRLLCKYDGETEDEKYWVDAMCDIAIDCKYTTSKTPIQEVRGPDHFKGEPSSSPPSSPQIKTRHIPNTNKATATGSSVLLKRT